MANQADFPVRTMCRVLGVSVSGFYAWRQRAPSQRSVANAVMTERRDKRQAPASDLVERQFQASAPNQLWVADMTCVPTWTGFLYLAVIIDVWSRRVVGWSIGERMTADLVLSALNMALTQRKPKDVKRSTPRLVARHPAA